MEIFGFGGPGTSRPCAWLAVNHVLLLPSQESPIVRVADLTKDQNAEGRLHRTTKVLAQRTKTIFINAKRRSAIRLPCVPLKPCRTIFGSMPRRQIAQTGESGLFRQFRSTLLYPVLEAHCAWLLDYGLRVHETRLRRRELAASKPPRLQTCYSQ
jgi:hypothetical protein